MSQGLYVEEKKNENETKAKNKRVSPGCIVKKILLTGNRTEAPKRWAISNLMLISYMFVIMPKTNFGVCIIFDQSFSCLFLRKYI